MDEMNTNVNNTEMENNQVETAPEQTYEVAPMDSYPPAEQPDNGSEPQPSGIGTKELLIGACAAAATAGIAVGVKKIFGKKQKVEVVETLESVKPQKQPKDAPKDAPAETQKVVEVKIGLKDIIRGKVRLPAEKVVASEVTPTAQEDKG